MSKGKLFHYEATINRPASDVYQFWKRWENFPLFMRHVKAVHDLGNNQTEWVVEGPSGEVRWKATTIVDSPNERIAWRSHEDADVQMAGAVTFREAPGNRGTEVRIRVDANLPGGVFGETMAKASGDHPEQSIGAALRNVKALLECGEIPIVEGQPSSVMRKEPLSVGQSQKVGLR